MLELIYNTIEIEEISSQNSLLIRFSNTKLIYLNILKYPMKMLLNVKNTVCVTVYIFFYYTIMVLC